MAEPRGGEKFTASAFVHPLRTPAGFVGTDIQPRDHMHHLGIWWPWKFVEVNGRKFNTWEIQQGQGAHVARSVKQRIGLIHHTKEWEFHNETIIKPKDAEPKVVIRENAHVILSLGGDATVLDITLRQQAADAPVTIAAHRCRRQWCVDDRRQIALELLAAHGWRFVGKISIFLHVYYLLLGPVPAATGTGLNFLCSLHGIDHALGHVGH